MGRARRGARRIATAVRRLLEQVDVMETDGHFASDQTGTADAVATHSNDNALGGPPARDELRRAVLRAAAGARAPAPATAPALAGRGSWRVLDEMVHSGRRYIVAWRDLPRPSLTLREREVVVRAQRGLHNKLIAYELGISHSTVRVLLARAAKRLAVRTREDLLRACAGVFEEPDAANEAVRPTCSSAPRSSHRR
jgi:DNA-binding CsgD family transcriptional regulator